MTKLKVEIVDESDEVEDTEFEDWQISYTQEVATDFVENTMMAPLIEFDFDENDENYVTGAATLIMFTKLVRFMLESGWESEDLKSIISNQGFSIKDTVH